MHQGRSSTSRYVALNRAACEYLHRPGGGAARHAPPGHPAGARGVRPVRPTCRDARDRSSLHAHGSSGTAASSLGEERYYDIRGVRAGPDLLSLTWSDVTDRLGEVRRLEESEQRYRLLAENVSDVVVHVRDGLVAWVSPSVEPVFGAPPQAWVGRPMVEFVHPDDLEQVLRDIATLTPDATVMARQRIRGADGTYHWVESNSRVYIDAAGDEDGFLTSLRVVDALVASERELARRAQHRRGHRPAEPGRGPPAPGRPHGPGTTARRPRRRAVLRRRLVQERQRQVRARDGRRGAPRHGRADQRDDPARTTSPPDSVATSSSWH